MPQSRHWAVSAPAQLGLLAGAFAVTTLTARLFADGWGTASGIGQIAFAAMLVALLLRAD